MSAIIEALAPIFLLIVLGYSLSRRRLVADAFWPAAETITYYLFFPCLLFHSLATADLDWPAVLPMAGALAGGILATYALLVLAVGPRRAGGGPALTSVVQGGIRANSYIALAAAANLYGDAGTALAAIAIAVVVPLVNLLSVAVLARHGNGGQAGIGPLIRGIVSNPLIAAVLGGIAWNAVGWPLPVVVEPLLQILGRAALPVGLLAVGAGLSLAAARRAWPQITVAAAAKLAVVPAVTLALCLAFGVDGLAAVIAVLYNANPTAASAFVLARQMGGDSPLMAGIITASTLAAAATVPLALLVASAVIGLV